MVAIGPHTLPNNLVLAPMAGVTDRPFRLLCRRMGAGLAISEMVTADASLWSSRKSRQRMDHDGESEPIAVQIAGGDAPMLAEAARFNVANGARIIDINMGCPAKKVCNKAAGSALMRDEALVREILESVAAAVDVPVTLKMRTGWDRDNKNAVTIARMAEDAGIAALAVHGRTRADAYKGEAEYGTIAQVKQAVDIPVFANGDVDTPRKAAQVLRETGTDGLFIGRAAQGRPWLFRQINHYLATGEELPDPGAEEIRNILMGHVEALHAFYGEYIGLRVARKHVGWYLQARDPDKTFRRHFNRIEDAGAQLQLLDHYFQGIQTEEVRVA
ncbi:MULTISPECIES: tRNA dihydrouridine synthase DusB [Gammaproteobacteria]|uniref:tRNA-dihydrouridine synthase B n=2 Tax=Halomonadaceae TaxID=28256 RepID=A0A2A2FCQ3_9GAMM|nr:MULTISPECIES: tRNA dihydrouridine synthase DusB [Gammaproteobacteria]KAA8983584.1 tRNA dihydrouridine synthase DusB [Halospina sp. K52047b]MYL27287.1 tRNA dihydrouridine synthase DusB [Halomonas utahensis]MYL74489.1 tRNA dihydrouridine synthase DusB [Halomonas sp. 22501_18_FS]PAU82467.1 tRNA dihydrouridine synthase DusB [Halovibrio salipaludis]